MQLYNGVLYWSPLAQAQYAAAQGDGSSPNIALNDVVFAIHAMVLTGVHLFQIAIYDVGPRRGRRVPLSPLSSRVLCVHTARQPKVFLLFHYAGGALRGHLVRVVAVGRGRRRSSV